MVLLVNQHTVPIFTDIANAYADSGFKVVLFSGHIERGGCPLSSSVKYKKSIAYSRRSTITRFFSWLVFSIHYAFYSLTCRKPTLIMVVTNPPLAPIITACISRLRKIPYHILVYDLYPEAIFQAGLVHNRNILFRLWQRINLWVFKGANKIFTLSESMKNAASKYVDQPEKIKVIYNWADTSYIHPVVKSENAFVIEHGLQNKFVVLYAGNMGLTHDLESLIEAAALLQEEPDLIFILIGDGGKRKSLENIAKAKSLQNVLFLPYQDEKYFPLAMASADIGVVTLGSGAEGISVPSKTYINLAAGLCLLAIAPESSELSRLITEHHAGLICEPGDAEKVASALRILLSDESLINQYKQNALRASSHFTSENAYEYVKEIMSHT